jgi:hypothetical protein
MNVYESGVDKKHVSYHVNHIMFLPVAPPACHVILDRRTGPLGGGDCVQWSPAVNETENPT